MSKSCDRAEILAGAVALGEATESERDEYRRHIAACEPCLRALGGEREIERVMSIVAEARESEVWAPAPVRAGVRRSRVRFGFGMGFGAAMAAVALSFAIHALVAANVKPVTLVADNARTESVSQPMHITLEKRSSAPQHQPLSRPATVAQAPAPALKPMTQPGIVVVHNVVTLSANKPPQSTVVHMPRANVNVDAQTSSQTVASTQGHAPEIGGNAESIAVSPSYVVRDVTPIGGVMALNPHPPAIAYAEHAEGTTAFEVAVDDRGNPSKCTITKSSGFLALDQAVCKAAMTARYQPRTVNGRVMAGIYRDAFTFHSSDEEQVLPNNDNN